MSVDYLRIKKYIKDNIPNSFLDGSIISVNYLEGPCPEKEINWQPWRNDGELLPISYLFYSSVINSTEIARKIKVPKGYTWLAKYISDSYKKADQDILPAAFIYLFSRDALDRGEYDIKPSLSLSSRDMFELLESSRDELLKKRCSIPDNHCKRFLDSDLEELLCLAGTVRSKEISIAKMVLAAVINMTNRYIMVEERYSDKEYERVEGLFQCRQNHIASSLAKTWSSYKTNKRVNNTKLQD